MKIKIDEDLPVRISSILKSAGHDVDTVVDEGLAGKDDLEVSRTATSPGRLVLTLDRGFGDIRRYPPGTHAGILVLRIADQAAPAVADIVTELVDAVDLEGLLGCARCSGRRTPTPSPDMTLARQKKPSVRQASASTAGTSRSEAGTDAGYRGHPGHDVEGYEPALAPPHLPVPTRTPPAELSERDEHQTGEPGSRAARGAGRSRRRRRQLGPR